VQTSKIFVRLLNDGTECWRPVSAKETDHGVFEILGIMPVGEDWQFAPGTRVRCQPKRFADGSTAQIAFALVVDQP
jgi:hypothetical protein